MTGSAGYHPARWNPSPRGQATKYTLPSPRPLPWLRAVVLEAVCGVETSWLEQRFS
ncbi:hypothetical protein [Cystobacter fuscus]|uniref:hypothetical protein n=1 Tax=Cystobacter fuscus TaxID=43 RepID=UPI0018DFB69A|nr:hypothetical protein [Cystobacter fuscus]